MVDIDYGEISQAISELNLHTKHFNKFNHTWNQTLFSLQRPLTQNRAKRIVKSIHEKLSTISNSQSFIGHNYYPRTIESQTSTSVSKISLRPSSNKKKSIVPIRIVKHNSLAASLEELENKIKDAQDFKLNEVIKKKSQNFDFDSMQELFSLKNAMSESTLVRIKDLEDRINKVRTSLTTSFIEKSKEPPQTSLKKSRALKKLRATQYFSNKSSSHKKLLQNIQSIKLKPQKSPNPNSIY